MGKCLVFKGDILKQYVKSLPVSQQCNLDCSFFYNCTKSWQCDFPLPSLSAEFSELIGKANASCFLTDCVHVCVILNQIHPLLF